MARATPPKQQKVTSMVDLLFVLVTVAFFAVSLGYVARCDRLK